MSTPTTKFTFSPEFLKLIDDIDIMTSSRDYCHQKISNKKSTKLTICLDPKSDKISYE